MFTTSKSGWLTDNGLCDKFETFMASSISTLTIQQLTDWQSVQYKRQKGPKKRRQVSKRDWPKFGWLIKHHLRVPLEWHLCSCCKDKEFKHRWLDLLRPSVGEQVEHQLQLKFFPNEECMYTPALDRNCYPRCHRPCLFPCDAERCLFIETSLRPFKTLCDKCREVRRWNSSNSRDSRRECYLTCWWKLPWRYQTLLWQPVLQILVHLTL